MPQPGDARIVINRDPAQPATRNPAAETEAKSRNKEIEKQIRERRRQIHNQADTDLSSLTEQEQTEREPAPIREDIESIEITLRDGRIVEYGPPTGVSLSDRIARLFSSRPLSDGGPDPGQTEHRLTRILMGVRAIEGKPVSPLSNLVQRTKLANALGDEAIDLLFYFDNLHWPPLTRTELPEIKKKFRT